MYLDEIILVILSLACITQLFYLFAYFSRLAFFKFTEKGQHRAQPVSVIIVARNEYKNLKAHLESVLNQDYPDYEVVVVNNGSWDESKEYLEQLEERYTHLKLVNIVEQEKYPKGKKFGLTLGIKASSNEWLLLTDSDCEPKSRNWISSMQQHFTSSKAIILGYSPYKTENSLLNLFIRFETFYTALQYLSFALAGKPYMGVGRNLAYRKSLFFSVKGFASHNHIISGDDDLFVNETATSNNTEICIHPDAFVYSEPKKDFDAWYRQKIRHLSTGQFYSSKSKWSLFTLNISQIIFYITFVIALIVVKPFYIPLAIYGLRLLSQFLIYGFAMKKLKEKNMVYAIPLMDLMYFFYYLFLGTITLFSPRRRAWMF